MIISHYYKFIFIKPRKVAGTTIELILSPFLEPGDLATSLQPEEEKLRVTKKGVLVGDIYKMNYFGLPSKLRDHSTLKKTYSLFNQSLEGYKVVSACRNPWDRAVSNFFWAKRHTSIAQQGHDVQKKEFLKFTNAYGPKTWMDHFYGRKRQRRLNSWHLYSDKKVCKVSYFIRFENLETDLSNLQNHLSLPYSPAPEGFQAKSRTRPKTTRPWQEYYDTKTIELVAKCCAEEINRFNYNFDGT